MKLLKMGLCALILGGCAQTEPEITNALQAPEEPSTSCTKTMAQLDEHQVPHTYQRAFNACHVPIQDETLVRRYVEALVLTGQYQTLKQGTAFSKNVDPELASYWTRWAKENL